MSIDEQDYLYWTLADYIKMLDDERNQTSEFKAVWTKRIRLMVGLVHDNCEDYIKSQEE